MPPLVVPDGMLVVCKGTNLGRPWANVWGLDTGGPTFLDQSLANSIGASFRAFYNTLSSSLVNEWTLDEILVQDLQTGTAPAFAATITPMVGTNTGDPLPAHLAIVATHRTALRGRSYRGRTYLNGWSEAANDANGRVGSTYRSLIVSTTNTLRTSVEGIAGTDLTLAVVSRKLLVATPIVSTTVDDRFDRQDRRKPRS